MAQNHESLSISRACNDSFRVIQNGRYTWSAVEYLFYLFLVHLGWAVGRLADVSKNPNGIAKLGWLRSITYDLREDRIEENAMSKSKKL